MAGRIERIVQVVYQHALKVFEAFERTIAEVIEIIRYMLIPRSLHMDPSYTHALVVSRSLRPRSNPSSFLVSFPCHPPDVVPCCLQASVNVFGSNRQGSKSGRGGNVHADNRTAQPPQERRQLHTGRQDTASVCGYTWPTRPVRFIVPLAAGGAMDFAARQCTAVLSRNLGQQVFVENRTGAGGTVGMDLAMRAAPDGYTFLVTNDNAAIAPHILHLPYDYSQELLPVIIITRQPIAFAVHPSLGVKSVAELVAYTKQNPGLGFASSGVGSNQHVLGAWFAEEAGIKLEHVPFVAPGRRSPICSPAM